MEICERERVERDLDQEEALKVTLAKSEALYRLSRSITHFQSLPDMFQTVVEGVAGALPADRVSLITFNLPERQVTHLAKGGPGASQVVTVSFDELWQGLSGWALRQRKPALSLKGRPDPRETPQVRRAEANCGSIIVAPLQYRDKMLGTLTAINRPDQPDFTEQDVELMTTVANQVAIALENTRLVQALRDSETRLQTVITNTPVVLWAMDPQGVITLSEGKGLEALGLKPGQVVGRSVFELYRHAPHVLAEIRRALAGEAFTTVVEVDGLAWEIRYAPLDDGRNEFAGVVAVGTDITERKRAEAELAVYREHLEKLVGRRTAELERAVKETARARDEVKAILQAVADGLIVTDIENRVVMANPAAEALLGFRLSEVLGREIGSGIKDDRLRKIVRDTLARRAGGYAVDIELETLAGQDKKVMRARTAPVNNWQGQPMGAVTIIQDVTRLREVDRLKTEFLAIAAHELRTPLTSILGFSEILLKRDLDESRRQHYITTIHKQGLHLQRIIEEILDISRLEAGRDLELAIQPVNLAELVNNEMMPFRETSPDHRFQIEGLSGLPPIMGDPFRLAQVVRNLISNAVKYSPDGGAVAIRGRVVEDHLEIIVQDEGIGMTPAQQSYLFEKFYRADASNTGIGGVGLGLAISKLIIEQHGGQIWVESESGLGTTVTFTLPLRLKANQDSGPCLGG